MSFWAIFGVYACVVIFIFNVFGIAYDLSLKNNKSIEGYTIFALLFIFTSMIAMLYCFGVSLDSGLLASALVVGSIILSIKFMDWKDIPILYISFIVGFALIMTIVQAIVK